RIKEFSIWDSHMVTHCSTNQTIRCLFTAERTGCEVFIVLWPNTLIQRSYWDLSRWSCCITRVGLSAEVDMGIYGGLEWLVDVFCFPLQTWR
ncbi:hypothetical protein L873DRAFT_1673518, partial [Choiromyces venosus 120613-1]